MPFLYVPLVSRAAVDRCALDPRTFSQLVNEHGVTRHNVFLFSTERSDDGATAYSRMLGLDREDPATGSASGPLGCYLVHVSARATSGAGGIISLQGVQMQRPSRVHIRIAGTPEAITGVTVGGASVLVGDGRISGIELGESGMLAPGSQSHHC